MPTGPKHKRFIPDEEDRNCGYREDCRCMIGEDHDDDGGSEALSAEDARQFTYTYDFGDNWRHTVTVEKVTPADPSMTYPVCTGGRRARPLAVIGEHMTLDRKVGFESRRRRDPVCHGSELAAGRLRRQL